MPSSSNPLFTIIHPLISCHVTNPIDKLFCVKQSPTPSCHVSEYNSFKQNVIVLHFNMCYNLAYILPSIVCPWPASLFLSCFANLPNCLALPQNSLLQLNKSIVKTLTFPLLSIKHTSSVRGLYILTHFYLNTYQRLSNFPTFI